MSRALALAAILLALSFAGTLVRADSDPEGDLVEEAPRGSPADEAKAKALWDKAVGAAGGGETAKRVGDAFLTLIVEMPHVTSYTPRAQALLAAGGLGEPLSLAERLEIQDAFLRGRPDLLEQWLRRVPERAAPIPDDDFRLALLAEALFPLALRDLWWRTTSDPAVRRLYERSADQAAGLTRRRLAWILGGGDGPYPQALGGETDSWPVLTTLVLDRLRRERQGKAGLPADSPLATRPPPEAWKDWWPQYTEDYLGWWMRRAYEGEVPETLDEPTRREREEIERLAAAVRKRNAILAVLAAVGLVLGVWILGVRTKPARARRSPRPRFPASHPSRTGLAPAIRPPRAPMRPLDAT